MMNHRTTADIANDTAQAVLQKQDQLEKHIVDLEFRIYTIERMLDIQP